MFDTVAVDIPVLEELPPPSMTARLPGGGEVVNYYRIDGQLLRPVRCDNEIAYAEAIFEEIGLVPRRWMYFGFFVDHPSAVFKVTTQPYREAHQRAERLPRDHRVRWTNVEERIRATTEIYSRCALFRDMLLAPAKPPTYRVMRSEPGMEMGIARAGLLREVPSYHFGANDFDLASQLVHALGAPGFDENDFLDALQTDEPGSIHDGSLATARSLAPNILKTYSRPRPGELGRTELMIYAALRDLHVGDATDEEASTVLNGLIEGNWPSRTRLPMQRIVEDLTLRRDLLRARYAPPELN